MISFSLIIDNTPIDLFSDESVQLVRKVKDLGDVSQARIEYTQQFTIPSTPTNDAIFSNFFEENILLSSWNPYLKKDAQIFIHSLPVFKGVIELNGVQYKNGLPYSYDIIFYGQVKDVVVEWGEQNLSDIDWSAYNHTVDYNAVIDSWYGNLLGGDILYPIADWHIGLQYCRKPIVPDNWYDQGIDINDLRPAILFKEMLTTCFSSLGATLTGSFLDKASLNNLYVAPMQGAGPLQNPTNSTLGFEVTRSGTYTINASTNFYNSYAYIPFNVETSDPSGSWSTTNYEYTSRTNGTFGFEFSVNVDSIVPASGVYDAGVYFAILVNNQPSTYESVVSVTGSHTLTASLTISRGDTIAVGVYSMYGAVISAPIFKTTSVPFGIEGSVMDMSLVMPKLKVTDFINGTLKAFNCIIVATGETSYEIHNIDDWYALGETKDFTKYIDTKSILHKKLDIPKSIKMKHQDGNDLASQQFASVNARQYGEVNASPIVDFAKDELEVESIFNVITPQLLREVNDKGAFVGYTNLQIPTMLDKDGEALDQPLNLFYYVGREATTFTYQLNGTTQYEFPLISSYSAFPTNSSTYSLAYGLEVTLQGDMPSKTMFVEYWQRYLSRLFSTQSRIVYFDAIIPVGEWLTLELNDTIAVSGNYYKIQSITYDMLTEKASLELLTYPDVDILTISSNGLTPQWTNATSTPNGITTLTGDIFAKQVTNAINIFGGYAVDVLSQTTFNNNNITKYKGVIDRIMQRKRVKIAKNNESHSVTTPIDNSYAIVPLDVDYNVGDGEDFVFSDVDDWIYYKYGGDLKITCTIGIGHNINKDMGIAILIDGQETLANTNMGKTDQSSSVTVIAQVSPEQKIQVGLKCFENHVGLVNINSVVLMVEVV